MGTNQESPTTLVVSYSFEELFNQARNKVAFINRQCEHDTHRPRVRVMWDDEVEQRLLSGAWHRIHTLLRGRLSAWTKQVYLTSDTAEFTFTLHGNIINRTNAIEDKLRHIVLSALMSELTGSADANGYYTEDCVQTYINELVSIFALDTVYD